MEFDLKELWEYCSCFDADTDLLKVNDHLYEACPCDHNSCDGCAFFTEDYECSVDSDSGRPCQVVSEKNDFEGVVFAPVNEDLKFVADMKVGDTFDYEGTQYKICRTPLKGYPCEYCDLHSLVIDCPHRFWCMEKCRKDYTDVLFKKIGNSNGNHTTSCNRSNRSNQKPTESEKAPTNVYVRRKVRKRNDASDTSKSCLEPISNKNICDRGTVESNDAIKKIVEHFHLKYNKDTDSYDCDGDVDLYEYYKCLNANEQMEFDNAFVNDGRMAIKFGTVNGEFNLPGNSKTPYILTSLEGCPKSVWGDFDCRYNQLTSLEGCPKKVGGGFYCCGNKALFTEEDVREVCEVKEGIYD